jgi:cold shock CspA family protein
MHFGFITKWNEDKGFGFIVSEMDENLFVHMSDFDITLKTSQVKEGMRVKFDIKSDLKGDRAVNVRKG